MAVQTRHSPGVYVGEAPSGVHTIASVSTSVTAFVGTARMGPVGEPRRVRSVADFVRRFGAPLDAANPMGHCVAHFFANGGSEAIVVRAARGDVAPATAHLPRQDGGDNPPDALVLTAASPGGWANSAGGAGLEVGVADDEAAGDDRFVLTIALREVDPRSGAPIVVTEETYAGLSTSPGDPRYLPTALAPSALVEATLPEVHGFSQSSEALPGSIAFSSADNVLRVAVDGGEPVEVELFAAQVAGGGTTTKARATIVTEIAALLDPHGVDAELGSDGLENFLVLTSSDSGGGSAVVVTPATADASAALHLGAAQGGTEASGADLLRPAATAEPVGFGGGADGEIEDGAPRASAADVVPADQAGGVYALGQLRFPRFNLLCLPGLTADDDQELSRALAYCGEQRGFLLVDAPADWDTESLDLGNLPARGQHGAIYYPRLTQIEPAPGGGSASLDLPPCGAVAGAIARIDAERGVWKAPAGIEAGLVGFADLSTPTDDDVSDLLNPRGVNVLREFPAAGTVIWGARTLKGDDTAASEHRFVCIRRTTDLIASSLYLGTQFAVFEPNDPDLWAQLRLAVGTYMRGLFRQGAFQQSAKRAESDSFFVVCDETVNPQSEIDLSRVNVVVGFAPLKPAEFVVVTITQISQLEE